MSLPRTWARLPGPADLLATIGEDLSGHGSVLVGLPEEVPGTSFAVEVAELVKRGGLGRWEAVRPDEGRATDPSNSVARRLDGGETGDCVLWVDATKENRAARAWADYARRSAGTADFPRMCIAMDMVCADACQEERGLRRRVWRDFVTDSDSRVLVERRCRRHVRSRAHTALKSALIAELAGGDLSLAERLAGQRLGRIFDANEHPPERIWTAQVSVVFPIVESERRRLLDVHRGLWHLPHTREDGRQIHRLEDLEVSDMAAQARRGGALAAERQRLDWLRRVRNALAHAKVVPWATLVSPIALQTADFRE